MDKRHPFAGPPQARPSHRQAIARKRSTFGRSAFGRSAVSQQSSRGGFTLLELLIVIGIIVLLMSILFVGVRAARGTADIAQVTNDIKEIEAALEAFKNEYGIYPPSTFVFDENGLTDAGAADAPDVPAAYAAANTEATATGLRLFPVFTPPEDADTPNFIDLDGDGSPGVHFLNGSECLVLFLAGPAVVDSGGNIGFLGLSANPTNPFDTSTTTNRKRFLEIDRSRVVDTDGDGMWELVDSTGKFQTPFNYLRATPVGGYRPQGPDGAWNTEDDETLRNGSAITGPSVAYYQAAEFGAVDVTGDGMVDSGTNVPGGGGSALPWNTKSYQIVWAGRDQEFGPGGVVKNADSGRVGNDVVNVGGVDLDDRSAEADNLTNFLSGVIGR